MIEILLVFALAIGLAWPLGHYLAKVMRGAPMPGDRVFGWLEKPVYRLLGTDPQRGMSWRGYAKAFLLSNIAVGVLVWMLLMTQAWLPLNPDAVPNMRWDLALHTMVSFLTNTNQQHYSGQAQLSYLSQMVGIVGLQVATPMMGLALVVATLRALFGGKEGDAHVTGEANVGNYWADVTRATVRVLLPLCLVWSLLLTSQGVPSTLAAGPTVVPIDASAQMAEQKIPLGPVAAMVAVKQLGTNGGGWYGPNSAVPLENPTPFSNLLEVVGIILLPLAVVFMVGPLVGRRKLTAMIFGCMLSMSAVSTGLAVWSEADSSTASDVAGLV